MSQIFCMEYEHKITCKVQDVSFVRRGIASQKNCKLISCKDSRESTNFQEKHPLLSSSYLTFS
uniref:Uncharacterized protein n=1 Tax=Arundo donax TaxID=35708 RepID=A0A0A9HL36_ARUDO